MILISQVKNIPASLIVLAAVGEKAAKDGGHELKVPFTGRTDATRKKLMSNLSPFWNHWQMALETT